MAKDNSVKKGRFAAGEKAGDVGKFCYDEPQGLSAGAKAGIIAVIVILIGAFFFGGFFFGANVQKTAYLSLMSNQPVPNNTVSSIVSQNQNSSALINIVAVTQDGNGAVSQAQVEVIPGDGKVLFSLNPFLETDTQDSVQTAAQVAQTFTGQNITNKDIIYSVENTQAQLVGGPSAGAAMTVATIAALEGKTVREDAAISGTINSDGTIGDVGGLMEKATAAAQKGYSLFVVPQGQKQFSYYAPEMQNIQRGGLSITRTRYVQKTTDLQSYIDQLGYHMQVVEAANINDAVKLMIN